MRARCGNCQAEVDVVGGSRFKCPECGAVNQLPPTVGGGVDSPVPGPGPFDTSLSSPLSPPLEPVVEPNRAACPDCGFTFVVGDIDVAICPNCRAEVVMGAGGESD